jgi:hypothetical protein
VEAALLMQIAMAISNYRDDLDGAPVSTAGYLRHSQQHATARYTNSELSL